MYSCIFVFLDLTIPCNIASSNSILKSQARTLSREYRKSKVSAMLDRRTAYSEVMFLTPSLCALLEHSNRRHKTHRKSIGDAISADTNVRRHETYRESIGDATSADTNVSAILDRIELTQNQ